MVEGATLMLFDTATAPNERRNVIADPKYANDVAELSTRLLAEMKRTDAPHANAFEAAIKKKLSTQSNAQ